MKIATYNELQTVFKKEQADAIVSIVENREEELVTKSDLKELKADLTIKLYGGFITIIGILFALKFL